MTFAEEIPSVRVRAPGKINVYLEVGALQDDGYHELATAFQAVSLYEDVVATMSDTFSLTITGADTVDIEGVPTDERNLALKAALMLADATGYEGGVHLDIHKQVPVAGGMGGGSADAAATLLACDALWDTRLTHQELHRLASNLGADVPIALKGGTAVGTGRGDVLNPALARGRFDWVLVTSDEGVSTPKVYSELDLHRERHKVDIGPVVQTPSVDVEVLHALRAGDPDMLAASLRNDLQVATLRLRPDLAAVLEHGEASGALAGIVSGSGPTLAFLCASPEHALELSTELERAGHASMHVHGPVPGARIVG